MQKSEDRSRKKNAYACLLRVRSLRFSWFLANCKFPLGEEGVGRLIFVLALKTLFSVQTLVEKDNQKNQPY